MSHLKRIIYCVSLASITALALFFVDEGGLALFPGFVLEGWLSIFVFIDPEEILLTSHAWGGNVVAYTILIYGLSWLATGIRVAYLPRRNPQPLATDASELPLFVIAWASL